MEETFFVFPPFCSTNSLFFSGSNWKKNNYSLLQGCEPGYTLIGDSCYLYIGAPVTHEEAKEFCRRDNASLPFLQKWYWEVQVR